MIRCEREHEDEAGEDGWEHKGLGAVLGVVITILGVFGMWADASDALERQERLEEIQARADARRDEPRRPIAFDAESIRRSVGLPAEER